MRKLLSLLLILFFSLISAQQASAKVIIKETGSAVVSADEVIDDDLFITGETVDILGTVNGDIYAAGGIVRFSGITTGDLIIGAGNVTISGEIGDDVIVGAGNVNVIQAIVGDSFRVGAGSVNIDGESEIGGSLLSGSGTLDNLAPIGRNLFAGAGLIKINAPVGGEVRVGGDKVELGSLALVTGDLTYMTESEITFAEGASVAGQTKKIERPQYMSNPEMEKDLNTAAKAFKTIFSLFSLFGSIIVGLVIIYLFKKPANTIAAEITTNFMPALGWGLLITLLSAPAIILLLITGVGIPLAFLLISSLSIMFCLAKIWAAYAGGLALQRQFSWKNLKPAMVMVVGIVAYYFLRNLPVIGFFVRLVAFLVGLGGSWLYLKKIKK